MSRSRGNPFSPDPGENAALPESKPVVKTLEGSFVTTPKECVFDVRAGGFVAKTAVAINRVLLNSRH
jgi:hypothetical protein